MTIIEMDGFAANPGDIPWEPWSNIMDPDGSTCLFTVYDRTPTDLIVARAKDADIILTNKVVFSEEIILQLPKLKYIGVLATGYNVVDIEAARKQGITVTNIPAYSTASVAQLAIAHLLQIANNVSAHDIAIHKGRWEKCLDFTFTVSPQIELAGKTFAVIGLGNTGMATAKIAYSLGMRILAYTSKQQETLPTYINKANSLEHLFREADVLSLHCPLTKNTFHLINSDTISIMKPTAILINTSRGPLIDEQALSDALNNHKLYAAGIDVLTEEPPISGSPLLNASNCYITPHIAWATLASRQRLMSIAIENVKAFIKGQPINVVN